jgi:hypothetical protein
MKLNLIVADAEQQVSYLKTLALGLRQLRDGEGPKDHAGMLTEAADALEHVSVYVRGHLLADILGRPAVPATGVTRRRKVRGRWRTVVVVQPKKETT